MKKAGDSDNLENNFFSPRRLCRITTIMSTNSLAKLFEIEERTDASSMTEKGFVFIPEKGKL